MSDSDLEIILPDDQTILVCPKCYTHNPEGSNFCLNCGLSLRTSSADRKKWLGLWVSAVLFIAAMFFFHRHLSNSEPRQTVRRPAVSSQPAAVTKKAEAPVTAEEPSPPKNEEISTVTSPFKVPLGVIVIKDITGRVINEVKAPVVGGGWIALPKQVCLGGADWILKVGPDTEVSIVGGIYNDYDKLGLWRILEDLTIDGPQLSPWSPTEQLYWISVAPDSDPEPVELENSTEQGYFTEGVLPGEFMEPGVLVQQDRVVGWTFGPPLAGAFVWNGDAGRDLIPEIRVDDFYRITFANSREEEFTRALAMGADYTLLERLEALAAGFKYEPKLSPEVTPQHLQKKNVIENLRNLIAEALKNGLARAVAGIFDIQMLVEAGDVGLLMAVGQATARGYGFEEATDLSRNVLAGLTTVDESDEELLKPYFSGLYQNWIAASLKNGNLQDAWRAYRLASREFPDSAEIHLMGVELALAENNWAEAEELLAARDYPASLDDKVKNLQNRISELKGQEGKIVINFVPGTRQIPLNAILNRDLEQQFIVDTGASLVTIPQATAEALGLTVDESNPLRKVYTAGGLKYVPEVVLSSITVGGWEVNNLKALILDLPNQPEYGLLGMNFLRRFHMDINTEDGVLLLEPR